MPNIDYNSQSKNYTKLNKRLAGYIKEIQLIFQQLNHEGCKIALDLTDISDNLDMVLDFSKYPQTKDRLNKLMTKYQKGISSVVVSSMQAEYKKGELDQDTLANNLIERCNNKLPDSAPRLSKKTSTIVTSSTDKAKDSFLNRANRGFNLESKLALQSKEYIKELESAISVAIGKGTDAKTLSKQVTNLFLDYAKLDKEYKLKFGEPIPSKNIQYQAMRLARSEINMAYRDAEQARWRDMPFVLGYEIVLSNNHNCKGVPKGHFYDICDDLAGKYPKDFKWLGWHPNCYHKDTKILTNNGWKLFDDVEDNDLIFSLNPNTKQTEWVGFTARQKYFYKGEMIRFYNRSLDCIVTPEHSMVYASKSNRDIIKRCEAYKYTQGKGAFIRSCSYEGIDVDNINIENLTLNFDYFCEFMAYYLSDGNLMHSGICISQKQDQDAYAYIISCVKNLGFEPTYKNEKITFYNSALSRYLSQFGTCDSKFIPNEILNASARQIRIFLDAYVRCDGNSRMCKSFVGNRGTVFSSNKMERTFFTTSHRLAGNISELLLKIGSRPSFSIKKPISATKKDGTIIKGKLDCYIIRECYSATSTQFIKEIVPYSDFVYDLTLEKNHIFYVSLHGKCFWGSNCRCHAVPIMMTDEQFIKWNNGNQVNAPTIDKMPKKFDKWLEQNKDRIERATHRGTLPYFLRDNGKYTTFRVGYHKKGTNETNRVYKILSKEDKFRITISKELQSQFEEIEKALGIKKGNTMSILEADSGNANFDKHSDSCQSSTVAMYMRMLGFDVKACKHYEITTSIPYMVGEDISLPFLSKNGNKLSKPEAKSFSSYSNKHSFIADMKKKIKNGSVYELGLNSNGYGHAVIAIKNKKGELYICETLSNESDFMTLDYIFETFESIEIFRLDDKIFNIDILKGLVTKM